MPQRQLDHLPDFLDDGTLPANIFITYARTCLRLFLHLLADDDLCLVANNDRVPHRSRICDNEIDLTTHDIYRNKITPRHNASLQDLGEILFSPNYSERLGRCQS